MLDTPTTHVEGHTLTTHDQTRLHALLYHPQESNQQTVCIAPAMGCKQSFYRHYATYLAEQGFIVLTFDYRGIGQSLNRRLWGYEAHLGQWGGQDLQAAIGWLKRYYPAFHLTLVGHSIGAMLLGLCAYNTRVDVLLGITPPNVYWGNWPALQKLSVLAFWYGFLPLTTMAVGYFPAPIFKLGERLPKGVALDWARAGRQPQALRGVYAATEYDHFDSFTGDVLCYSFADDALAPQKAVDNFMPLFPQIRSKQHIHLKPAEIGLQKIGHHGFFRESLRETLWGQSVDWLLNPQKQVSGQFVSDVPQGGMTPSEAPAT